MGSVGNWPEQPAHSGERILSALWVVHQFRYFPSSVPGPPGDIKALPYRKQAILVSWKLPEECNGVITTYTLYQRTVGDKPNSHVSVRSFVPPSFPTTERSFNKLEKYQSNTLGCKPNREGFLRLRLGAHCRSPGTCAKIISYLRGGCHRCTTSLRLLLIARNPCFAAGGEEVGSGRKKIGVLKKETEEAGPGK